MYICKDYRKKTVVNYQYKSRHLTRAFDAWDATLTHKFREYFVVVSLAGKAETRNNMISLIFSVFTAVSQSVFDFCFKRGWLCLLLSRLIGWLIIIVELIYVSTSTRR